MESSQAGPLLQTSNTSYVIRRNGRNTCVLVHWYMSHVVCNPPPRQQAKVLQSSGIVLLFEMCYAYVYGLYRSIEQDQDAFAGAITDHPGEV